MTFKHKEVKSSNLDHYWPCWGADFVREPPPPLQRKARHFKMATPPLWHMVGKDGTKIRMLAQTGDRSNFSSSRYSRSSFYLFLFQSYGHFSLTFGPSRKWYSRPLKMLVLIIGDIWFSKVPKNVCPVIKLYSVWKRFTFILERGGDVIFQFC